MLLNIFITEAALGVSYISLGNILRSQFLNSFVVVVNLALLVVLLIEVVLLISVDVFSLDDFPDVEQFDGIIDSILDLHVVLLGFFHVYLQQ